MNSRQISDLKQVLVVAKFEIVKHLKSKRFLATLILLPPITILLYLSVFQSGATVIGFARDYLITVPQIAIVLGIFFGIDAISSEFEEKTGYVTLSNPVGRGWLTLGKLIAGIMIVTILIGVVFLAGIIYMIWSYQAIATGIAPAFLYALLLGYAALGVAFFLSAALPGDITPWVFGYFLLIMIMPVIEYVLRTSVHMEPWYLLTFSGRVLPAFIQSPITGAPQRVVVTTEGGTIYNYPEFSTALIVMLAYLLISLALAIYFFKRREMH